jgi:hypothetical protein
MSNEKADIIADLHAKITLGMKDRAFDVLVDAYRRGILNASEYMSFRDQIDRIKD